MLPAAASLALFTAPPTRKSPSQPRAKFVGTAFRGGPQTKHSHARQFLASPVRLPSVVFAGLARFLRRRQLEIFVRAFEVFDLSVFEVPDARGHFVQDIFVVRHQ